MPGVLVTYKVRQTEILILRMHYAADMSEWSKEVVSNSIVERLAGSNPAIGTFELHCRNNPKKIRLTPSYPTACDDDYSICARAPFATQRVALLDSRSSSG